MNRTTRLIGLGLLVATCAVALAAIDPLTLKLAPKVGDTMKFRLKAEIATQMGNADVTADISDKITKVEGDSFTVESSQTNMKINFNGSEMPGQDGTNTSVSKLNGEIVDMQGEEQSESAWRVAELDNFIYPDKAVNVGDTWSYTLKADDKKGIVAAQAEYKVDSLEKIGTRDTVKIKQTYKETAGSTPASSDGFVWLDTKDGTVVKKEMTWTDVPLGPTPINGKITVERVD